MQEEELTRKQTRPVPDSQPPVAGAPESITDLRTQTQTQVDISRAPSPAEARPIRAIPVPEDWVPLGRREWSAQRKYWAAAATCHMPLYFQDPMLERYGHSVEQYFGPLGRYMAYPVDDHTADHPAEPDGPALLLRGPLRLANHHLTLRFGRRSPLGSPV